MFDDTSKYCVGKITPVKDGYVIALIKTSYCPVCGTEHNRVIRSRFITKEQYEEIAKKHTERIKL